MFYAQSAIAVISGRTEQKKQKINGLIINNTRHVSVPACIEQPTVKLMNYGAHFECFYVNDEPDSKFLYTQTIKLYCIAFSLYCIFTAYERQRGDTSYSTGRFPNVAVTSQTCRKRSPISSSFSVALLFHFSFTSHNILYITPITRHCHANNLPSTEQKLNQNKISLCLSFSIVFDRLSVV